MSTRSATPRAALWFNRLVLFAGLAVAALALTHTVDQGWRLGWLHLLLLPLIVVIARFPLVFDHGDDGVEVGFDSSVLMFLACTLPPEEALLVWAAGITLTQLSSGKRAASQQFNIGVGLLGGAASVGLIWLGRGDAFGTPQELGAVVAGAAGYFATDLLLSVTYIALLQQRSIVRQVMQPVTAMAVACFIPFDSLGYLAAVVVRSAPWWTAALLVVPLATLLVATRAVTRGRENARRLRALFDAAVRIHAMPDRGVVVTALVAETQRLLHLSQVELRTTPPDAGEIGAELVDDGRHRWLVVPVEYRARSTSGDDQQALDAVVAVASDALARLRLGEEMTHLARHDILTGLVNRGELLRRVEHVLSPDAPQARQHVALLFCDLDGFKQVNDRLGHAVGDALLVDAANRLRGCVRDTDTVGRIGGDEFAILLTDIEPACVDATCERILAALTAGRGQGADREPSVSISIGVATADTATSATHLLRNSDVAMYEAKALGKNRFIRYQPVAGPARPGRLAHPRGSIPGSRSHVLLDGGTHSPRSVP